MNIESLNISRDAYPYLVAQRGALDDMKGDPGTWCAKYIDVLYSEFRSIEPYLPKQCRSILDVGSGLGGIDALLNEHYGGDCQVTLLDGIADPPQVTQHSSTFNHMEVAQTFLLMNGVQRVDWIDANDPAARVARTYDLIVSFKSWCFHVDVDRYLPLVLTACVAGHTQLLVDIRGGRQATLHDEAAAEKHFHTMRALTTHFRHLGMIHYGIKFETHHFEAL
jgi:SAM-dependent methyltransferase